MKKIRFSTTIHASKEKVWEQLWSDESYRKWTAAFMEGSYAESDWNEGSKILFLTPKRDGMFGIIEKKIPNEQITFKYYGDVKKGIEEPKDYGGAKESYYLTENNGVTSLQVEMDANDELEPYFSDTFPKALTILKQISEG